LVTFASADRPHCAARGRFLNTPQGTFYMQTQSSVFDDLAKLMTGAMGMAQGMGEEAKGFLRGQADRFVAEMDLVSRDEFEAVKQMASEARAEADALRAKIAELEAKLRG
jgi:BMFP domain-containing protein YqiC